MRTLPFASVKAKTERMVANRYAPANPRQKLLCAALLISMLIAWAIYFAGWRLFGAYEWQVALAVQLVALFYVVRLLAILGRS